jgi:hypothetical protein
MSFAAKAAPTDEFVENDMQRHGLEIYAFNAIYIFPPSLVVYLSGFQIYASNKTQL